MILKSNRTNEDYSKIVIAKTVGESDLSDCGAFREGDTVTLSVSIPRDIGASGAVLRIARDGEADKDLPLSCISSELDGEIYTADLLLEKGLYFYEILILRGLETVFSHTENNFDYTFTYSSNGRFSLLVYDKDYAPMHRENVMYHIFVDRFSRSAHFDMPKREDAEYEEDWYGSGMQYARKRGGDVKNNRFYGGSLYGICEKLDYLKSLGVSVLYLSPIFEAYSNHKYDTGNYMKVDEGFGGDEALAALLSGAHERGIRVILDGVFNHTGDDSLYFNKKNKYDTVGAYNSKNSKYYDWYIFKDYPDEYECWWGIRIHPRLNLANKECRDYICNEVCKKYMKMGVDGFRLDVADELCDDFLCEFRESMRNEKKDAALIGEVWENAVLKEAYGERRRYFHGDQLDSVMNYPFRTAAIHFFEEKDSSVISDTLKTLWSTYPREVCHSLMNIVGTHDTERILSMLGGADSSEMKSGKEAYEYRLPKRAREEACKKLLALSALQYTVYGFPCLYYGDEAGLEGLYDPFCRMPYPWGGEDEAVRAHYERLGKLREHPCFDKGSFKVLRERGSVFGFRREKDGVRVDVYINSSKKELKLGKTIKGADLYNGGYRETDSIPPYGFIIMERK